MTHNGEALQPNEIITDIVRPEVLIDHPDLVFVSGSSNLPLAREVAELLNVKLQKSVSHFADGEPNVHINSNLRKKSVYILQSTSPPHVGDNHTELLCLIDAAKRAHATDITAIMPYAGLMRGDRKVKARVPITAAVAFNTLRSTGATGVMTIDLHSLPTQGFFDGPADNLESRKLIVDALSAYGLDDPVVMSPDFGGFKRASQFAEAMKVNNLAAAFKQRDFNLANVTKILDMIGDVNGRDVFIPDDIGDTLGTLAGVAEEAKRRGARRIMAGVTHGVFSGAALQTLMDSHVEKLIVTNTINHREEVRQHPKIEIVSVAPMIADAMVRNQLGQSISGSPYLIYGNGHH